MGSASVRNGSNRLRTEQSEDCGFQAASGRRSIFAPPTSSCPFWDVAEDRSSAPTRGRPLADGFPSRKKRLRRATAHRRHTLSTDTRRQSSAPRRRISVTRSLSLPSEHTLNPLSVSDKILFCRRNIADLVLPDRGGEGGCSRPPASGPCSSARQALSGNATATSSGHGEGAQCVLHAFLQRRRTPLLVLWAFLLVPLRHSPAPTVPAAGPPPVASTAACFPDDLIACASRVS